MNELSAEEMTSIRGGAFDVGTVASIGNVGISVPINIQVLSDNAIGKGATVNDSHNQSASSIVGNQWVDQLIY
jgi:hypothetical protein